MRISDWSSDVCSSDLPKVNGAVVVLADGDERWPGWNEFEGKPLRTCIGGAARADSVLAGLAALPDDVRPDDFVLVHDAARPNLSATHLDQLLERGRGDPAGPVLAAPGERKRVRGGKRGAVRGNP